MMTDENLNISNNVGNNDDLGMSTANGSEQRNILFKSKASQQTLHEILSLHRQRSSSTSGSPVQKNMQNTCKTIDNNQTNSKKRSYSNPEEITRKQPKSDYWLGQIPSNIQTSNRFESLELDADGSETVKKVDRKPPPIYVARVNNINLLTQTLTNIAKDQYTIKTLHDDQIRIQPTSAETYSIIVKKLLAKKTEFHTYKSKKEKSFKVILRNLYTTLLRQKTLNKN